MRVYITGVSGTGKSTVAGKLQEEGIHTIDLDDVSGLCQRIETASNSVSHWYPGIGQEFFDTHEYVCDRQKLIELIGNSKNVVVAGVADNWSEIKDLFDRVYLFCCDEEIFLRRIRERTNHDFGKHDSEQDMIRGWYKEFEKEMLSDGAVPIDASQQSDVIVSQLLKDLRS